MKYELTKEELEAIKLYKNEKSTFINQLLITDVETDIEFFSKDENKLEYSRKNVIESIDFIKMIYEIMKKRDILKDWTFYKGANIAEIDYLKKNSNIDKFLLLTPSKQNAEDKCSSNLGRTAILQFSGKDILYIDLKSILLDDSNEVIVSPFTKITSLEEINEDDEEFKLYSVKLENQHFKELSNEEEEKFYQDIIDNADKINSKLEKCIELDDENLINYENIRKLEQLLAKHHFAMEQENYDVDTTKEEKQDDLDDISRITLELDSLKDIATDVYNTRLKNSTFVANWKKNINNYLMSEFKKIDLKYEKSEEVSQEKVSENSEENKIEFKSTGNEKVDNIKSEAIENIETVNELLKNIKKLISKQQNHARIAEKIDSNYRALNNAFEMKNYAEELESLVNMIYKKIDVINSKNEKILDNISKTSHQIGVLLNYLNNAKSATSKKISRFDEINIIEENELKREIAETVKNIRCEAELKKLRDDVEIIQEKGSFKKFIGRFTGRNKLDQTMLTQIEIRQTAIRKTFKIKMPLAYNYSIHELIAEIEMFIRENNDDELVIEDVNRLRKIKEELKKNFVIIDSKVLDIINQRTGKNLPVSSEKVSKKELIEIDTYRFLNKYGYDKTIDTSEPEYQDTLANEIKRIVDYIKTSEVL